MINRAGKRKNPDIGPGFLLASVHTASLCFTALVTLPERRQRVQTYTWQGAPLTTAFTRLTLGFQGRLDRRWE